MIATIIVRGKIVSVEEVPLTFHTTQQTLLSDQHPKGESESYP